MGQKLEGAVNGDVADFGVCFRDLGINLWKTLVAGGVQEDIENLFPLLGCLQPLLRNPCFEKIGFDRPP